MFYSVVKEGMFFLFYLYFFFLAAKMSRKICSPTEQKTDLGKPLQLCVVYIPSLPFYFSGAVPIPLLKYPKLYLHFPCS